jgi:protein-disulfide isomerase
MRRTRAPLAAALALLSLAACHQRPPDGDDAAFGRRVRAYLLGHPEVLQEAGQKLQARLDAQDADAARQSQRRLPSLRAALERDPGDFVANPAGSITVSEFFDYRCPHCVAVAPAVLALARSRRDVRLVFKEMPIFGPTSEHAARDALAVKAVGGDYLGLYRAYMATPDLTDARIDQIALAHGARPSDLQAQPAAQAQLSRNQALFTKLGLSGTPAFVVGDQIIYGEDLPAVDAAIRRATGGGAPSG